jgi:hypothetical protein
MNIAAKRKKVTEYILTTVGLIDKYTNANNVDRLKTQLSDLSDTAFDNLMKLIRDKRACIYIYIPNMDKHPSMENIFGVANKLKIELFQHIYMYDDVTGETMLTPEKYMIVKLPIRRMEQYGDHKLSLPEGDSKIDAMTGQVTHEDRSAGITNPEIQALASKGLNSVLKEVVSIRGGNIEAWQTGIKKQAEENGVVYLENISKDSKNRTVVVGQILLESLHLENNLAGGHPNG